jgi:acetyl esterase/lipase
MSEDQRAALSSPAPAVAGQSSSIRLLFISVSLVVLACVLAWRVQSSGGRVRVYDIKIPTQNGQWVVADLFKPATATSDHPAPLVVVVPGFQRSKEALAAISIELSRRGAVVIAIDPYAQGSSSSSASTQAATTEGYGMFAVVDYAVNTGNLNYVDKGRVGVTGHSAGGNAAVRGAAYFGRRAKKSGKPSALNAIFVSGYLLSFTESVLKDVRSNVGTAYAYHDEGAYRNELKNGDMRRAPEAVRLLNSGLEPGAAPLEEVTLGKYYGDASAGTLRVVYNERVIHPLQPYDVEATANQIDYWDRVFDLKSGLSSRDQVWYWKELLGLVALAAALAGLVPLAQILLRMPVFRPLVHPLPAPMPAPRGRGRVLFRALSAVGALVACFTYIPMSELSQRMFVAASNREPTWFFPQRMNNAVMLWAVLNGLVGFLLMALGRRFAGNAQGPGPDTWDARIGLGELARTCALAAVLFLAFYGLLFAVYSILHVDYRFLFMGVRVFQPELILLLGMYVPFFLLFFLSNSFRVNGAMRVDGQPEWMSLLLAGVASSAGLLLIVVVQYVTLAATGTVYWTEGWLYVNLLFAVVPMMFVLPYFNRYFFRMTGRPYLGPLTTSLVFVMILLSNTVCYLPL